MTPTTSSTTMTRPAQPAATRALFLAAGQFPDRGLHQPAAVQGQPRQDVEDRHQEVRQDENIGQQERNRLAAEQRQDQRTEPSQRKVGYRPGQRHHQRLARCCVEIVELGVAAPQIEHNLGRWPAEGPGGQGVGEFVDQHGEQQQQRITEGHPVSADTKVRYQALNLGPEDQHDESGDDEPGPGEHHRHAEHAAQRNSFAALFFLRRPGCLTAHTPASWEADTSSRSTSETPLPARLCHCGRPGACGTGTTCGMATVSKPAASAEATPGTESSSATT